jgi:hypothetical protein
MEECQGRQMLTHQEGGHPREAFQEEVSRVGDHLEVEDRPEVEGHQGEYLTHQHQYQCKEWTN